MPIERTYGAPSGLVEVIDRILDKGLVIDAWVRVSVIGLEVLTIEARIVIASVDTYLRYAEAVSRLGLVSRPNERAQSLDQAGQGLGQVLQTATAPLQSLTSGQNDQQNNQSQNGQAGNNQNLTGGLANQLQGLIDQLNTNRGGGQLAGGVTDQLRGIVNQLQTGQGSGERAYAG